MPWPGIVFARRNPGPLLFCLLTTISLGIIIFGESDSPITVHFSNQINHNPDPGRNTTTTMILAEALTRGLHVAQQEHFVHDVPGTYPRLCRLADGSILAGFTAFEPNGGQRILSIARSTDDARTFHPHGEVTRSRGDCDNLFLLQLPPSSSNPSSDLGPAAPSILAAFRNHDIDDAGNPTYFRITVCHSTDGGRTWSFLSQAFEKPAPFGLWEPFLRLARDGAEVQLYFAQEMDADDQDTMVVRSVDGGRTWSEPVRVTGEGERLRDGMVGLAETECAPGVRALVMVLETTRRGRYSIEALVSFDQGGTFELRQVVYEPVEGKNAGAPQIAALDDGSVAIVFMTDEDGEGEATWPQGAKIKAMYGSLLEDGKLALSKPAIVAESASSWPGVMSLSSNSALAVFETSSRLRGRLLMSPLATHAN
jgi:hypothetical protein